ncbi:heterokaryon incompatibility protein-domain-containing protein [Microdochium trichocladiopsis]|uniref:Heterokaryon incompatibility protein-domain-containing protein n=1 Tax=Microdochium trichocladiopsis TaxID=1682393 RepID=A0A9P9BLX3_9PEZI|nr:heterokaryon incompatibility protein-domain-containing protein [Microdochium trichocladiopsis]KAH7024865.1 heterokaryon incompatibility protein-domain-containing protein [Microdochium trichocladiopsis]
MRPPIAQLDPSLAQIRILQIEPEDHHGAIDTQLRCQRRVVSLDDKPAFAALSYVWGDQKSHKSILVDGEPTPVTDNLYDALLWYRSWKPDVPIWADAICINQGDVAEKNHQVGMMARVYEQAVCVVCWLGPSTPRIDAYLDRGVRLCAQVDRSPLDKRLRERLAWALFRCKSWLTMKSSLEQARQVLELVLGQVEFFQLAYFQRMWTFQEELLSPTSRVVYVLGSNVIRQYDPREPRKLRIPIFVGNKMNSINPRNPNLDEVGKRVVTLLEDPNFLRRDIVMAKITEGIATSRRLNVTDRFELLVLLSLTLSRKCKDPRDKLFAVMGLLAPVETVLVGGQIATQDSWGALSFEEQDELLTAARERYLAVDYSKDVKLVVLDALYYIHHYESDTTILSRLISRYPPTGPWTAAIPPDDPRYEAGTLAPQALPSWLPNTSKPLRSTIFPSIDLSKDETSSVGHVKWTKTHCEGRTRDMLRFRVKFLGEVIMLSAFPSTTSSIVDMVISLLEEASEAENAARDAKRATRSLHDRKLQPHHGGYNFASLVEHISPTRFLASRLDYFFRSAGDSSWSHDTPRWTDDWYALRRPLQPAPPDRAPAQPPPPASPPLDEERGPEPTNEAPSRARAETLHGLAVFVLDTGRFGVCANTVRVGDRVALSMAWETCLVLRAMDTAVFQGYQVVDYTTVEGIGGWVDKTYVEEVKKMRVEEVNVL